MSGYLPLAGAIVIEVLATLSLRGATRQGHWWQWLIVVVGYATAFALLALALRTIGVGPAYALWSGLGTAGIAVAGWFVFGERLSVPAMAGIGLIIAGVVLIELGGRQTGVPG
ncbi:MAG: multidrug efflux SMR transporter [Propionibacteriaceae bacterium]|nr:multidrug efflux SMR transporter [Propionibacteriaceae bacterium]